MERTREMPPGLTLDGHKKVTMGKLAILGNDEFAKSYYEIRNYKIVGEKKPVITRWVDEADAMLKQLDDELRLRVESNEISLDEFAAAVEEYSRQVA